jgi:hypothetical protein
MWGVGEFLLALFSFTKAEQNTPGKALTDRHNTEAQ